MNEVQMRAITRLLTPYFKAHMSEAEKQMVVVRLIELVENHQ